MAEIMWPTAGSFQLGHSAEELTYRSALVIEIEVEAAAVGPLDEARRSTPCRSSCVQGALDGPRTTRPAARERPPLIASPAIVGGIRLRSHPKTIRLAQSPATDEPGPTAWWPVTTELVPVTAAEVAIFSANLAGGIGLGFPEVLRPKAPPDLGIPGPETRCSGPCTRHGVYWNSLEPREPRGWRRRMAHGSAAVPYRWDQCVIPHGTGAGPARKEFAVG